MVTSLSSRVASCWSTGDCDRAAQIAETYRALVELNETADQVQLRIHVRPRDAEGATCPSNPSTPFTGGLSEPLGDREIVNASVMPPRPLTVAGGR